jgi:hypothetical protein
VDPDPDSDPDPQLWFRQCFRDLEEYYYGPNLIGIKAHTESKLWNWTEVGNWRGTV